MTFEWRNASHWAGWWWVVIGVLIAAPLPLYPFPLVERGWPIFVLLVAGAGVAMLTIARASWPLALLLMWALGRAAWMGFSVEPISLSAGAIVMEAGRARPVQLLVLLTVMGLLYAAARECPRPLARYVAIAIVIGVVYEGVFGTFNVNGWYPWMVVFDPSQFRRPMGFLTHPNYWGSYMALGLPLLWSTLGFWSVCWVYGLILFSYSPGPVISASVGLLILVWPGVHRLVKVAVLGGAGGIIATVMTVHEWRLSGRLEVWSAIWPELTRYPVIGQGLGSWRIWADQFNAKLSIATGKAVAFATLQAHNEPYQLWFELGLVGVALAGLFLWQIWTACRKSWAMLPPIERGVWWWDWRPGLERAWIAMLAIAAVNALGSPVLHLPGQAALIIFAIARVQAHAATHEATSSQIRKGVRHAQKVG